MIWRHAAFFLARFSLMYGLLVAPWPGVQEQYARFLRWGGGICGQPFVRGATIQFRAVVPADGARDVDIVIQRPPSKTRSHTHLESRTVGYLPTAFFLALTLATPASFSRKRRTLGYGLAAMTLFIGGRIAIAVLLSAVDSGVSRVPPTAPLVHALAILESAFLVQSSSSFVVPFLVWILVGGPATWVDSLRNVGSARSSRPTAVSVVPTRRPVLTDRRRGTRAIGR